MKNKIIFLVLGILLFTGCNKTQLICSKKEKNPGYDYYEKYEFIYNEKGNSLERISLNIEAKYNEMYTKEEIEEEYNSVKNYCDIFDLSDTKVINCDVEKDDNLITIEALIKVSDISNETFEQVMYVTKDEISTKKATKELLKNVGYSCE